MRLPLSFHLVLWLLLLQAALAGGAAALQPATPAPAFTLTDLQGGAVRIAELHGKELLLLLFFDAESRPSLESLKGVNALALRHPSQLAVYGISSSPPEVIKATLDRLGIRIPVLRATAPVRELYQARHILPVGCVIGRGFKVLSYYQGGGEGFTPAVIGAVERELRRDASAAAEPAHARPAPSRKVEHAARRQKHHERTPAPSPKAAATAPAAAPAAPGPAAAPPAATAGEPPPRTPDRSNPQNSLGKILNDNEW